MCYNCGCFNPEDDMGHKDNITEETFKHLSEYWKKPIKETKEAVYKMLKEKRVDPQMEEIFEKASIAWGQSLDEAKKNALTLLKDQVG